MARRFISSESYIIPVILAVGLEALILGCFFVSWSSEKDLVVPKPTMVAQLYEVTSKSPAKTQTDNKLAGQAEKTKAPTSKPDQIATTRDDQQEKVDKEKDNAAKLAQEKADKEAKDKAAKLAKEKADKEAKDKAAKLAKEKADKEAKDKAAKLAKEKADKEAKDKAAKLAKEKADKEAKDKAAKLAKEKADKEAKDKAAKLAQEKAAKLAQEKALKAQEDKEAAALADLLSNKTEIGATKGDEVGSQVVGDLDSLVKQLVQSNWTELGNPAPGTQVTLTITMLPDGIITGVTVSRSSGNVAFDNSAVTAAKNVGRIPEIQKLDSNTFNQLYRQRNFIFTAKGL